MYSHDQQQQPQPQQPQQHGRSRYTWPPCDTCLSLYIKIIYVIWFLRLVGLWQQCVGLSLRIRQPIKRTQWQAHPRQEKYWWPILHKDVLAAGFPLYLFCHRHESASDFCSGWETQIFPQYTHKWWTHPIANPNNRQHSVTSSRIRPNIRVFVVRSCACGEDPARINQQNWQLVVGFSIILTNILSEGIPWLPQAELTAHVHRRNRQE